MCGIVGIYNFHSGEPADPIAIQKMANSIAHRGPDDEGFYFDNDLGFGFRRLSIIDLAGGHQPMENKQKTVCVIFNGEIYNYIELRQELQQRGYVFVTNCDTEVIVHGYSEWGVDCLEKLSGMFGLAVWDQKNRQLMLARDRAGIKLVYYEINAFGIAFGSEIRAVQAARSEHCTLDIESIYCAMRYRFTPSPKTIYSEVRKLAPGTRMIIKSGEVTVERYWKFSPEPFDRMPSAATATEQLGDLYKKAVRRQIRSDVPVGLLLSGGVDSALLLSLMKNEGASWSTFSVGYGREDADDELEDAAKTARLFSVENRRVLLSEREFYDGLSKVVDVLEEPIASGSVVAMYFLCKAARESVKVALMGQGPDELFGGYARHIGVNYSSYWRNLPKSTVNFLGRALLGEAGRELVRRGLYAFGSDDRLTRYQRTLSIISDAEARALFRAGMLSGDSDSLPAAWRELVPFMGGTDELGGLQYIEVRSTLPDELLMYADKISMWHGLELRVPYLDHEIIEYAEKLDATYKIKWGSRKWLHRRVARAHLPDEIVGRRKRAFTSNVVARWLRSSLDSQIIESLRDPQSLLYSYMDYEHIQNIMREYKSGKSDNFKLLFSIALLETWLRKRNFSFA